MAIYMPQEMQTKNGIFVCNSILKKHRIQSFEKLDNQLWNL